MARPKGFDPDTAVHRAMTLFWRNGYNPTSPRQLADHLGIGAGSLYNAFGSKYDLFLATLTRYHDHEASKLTDALAAETGPVRDRIRAAVQPFLTADELAGCFAVNTAVELGGTDEQAAILVRRMFDRLRDTLRGLIEEGQRAGEIRPGQDPAALADVLLNTINGLRVLIKTGRDPADLRRILDTTLDLL